MYEIQSEAYSIIKTWMDGRTDGWMDRWMDILQFYVIFNYISVISGSREGDNKKL